jgi:hypothetical protein
VKRLAALLAVATTGLALTACSPSANTYWYCWDEGAKDPHHLGHYVEGDHVCSDEEPKGTGFSPRS